LCSTRTRSATRTSSWPSGRRRQRSRPPGRTRESSGCRPVRAVGRSGWTTTSSRTPRTTSVRCSRPRPRRPAATSPRPRQSF
jgi:hypothetical protein